MLKKFLVGTFAVAALAFALSASAAYDFGTTTLKVGSKGEAVKTLQTLVGVKADGSFGPATKAAVIAWQKANGLTADGLFGKASMAKANGGAVVVTPSKPVVSTNGAAGDLTVSTSSKDVEDKIKEGGEEKVLALKLEAEDSDIQLTNLKIELKRDATNGDANASEKLADYVDSVKVYLGSSEVASVDASDFSRESGNPDLFTKSISLKNAVVKDGDVAYLYVAAVAADSIDSDDDAATLKVTTEQLRYTDGTGAIMTDETENSSNVKYNESFGFKTSSSDDDLAIKSSSANPDDATIKVDEDKTTDDILALAFKLDNDDDSSDMDLQTIEVTADTSLLGGDAADIEKLIDAVTLKIGGEEFDAEDLADADVTSGTATYTFDIDGDVSIDAGDVEEAKVYVSFNEQGTANYSDGVTVEFAVSKTGLEAETDGDSVSSSAFSGSQTGALLTVNSSAATVSGYKWTVTSSGTILDFFFAVEAENDDYRVLSASVEDSTAGTATFANSGAPTLSKYSGTAEATTGGYIVSEGEKATFRLRYTLTATAADNGKWAEATVTSVAGQTVPEDNQTSTTATVNL